MTAAVLTPFYRSRAVELGNRLWRKKHRHGTAERPQQDGAAAGKDPGPAPAGERSVRPRSQRNGRGSSLVLADQARSQKLARSARGRLSAAHQSHRGFGRGVMVEVHAADRGRSLLSGAEERAFSQALVSPVGAARKS